MAKLLLYFNYYFTKMRTPLIVRWLLSTTLIFSNIFSSAIFAADEGTGHLGPGSKVIQTAYFNQYLEPNGGTFPPAGWKMCGAASAVISLSKFNKPILLNNNDYSFKAYMYKDKFIDGTSTPPCGFNQGGAFTLTNINCSMSYVGGIQKYIQKYFLSTKFLSKNISLVKQAIDKGHPIIFSFGDSTDPKFGHIATIVGYTSSNKIIVHDTYTNVQNLGRGWKRYYTGKYVIYDLFTTRWPIGYLLEIY